MIASLFNMLIFMSVFSIQLLAKIKWFNVLFYKKYQINKNKINYRIKFFKLVNINNKFR